MNENHSKLEVFQNSLNAALEKRLLESKTESLLLEKTLTSLKAQHDKIKGVLYSQTLLQKSNQKKIEKLFQESHEIIKTQNELESEQREYEKMMSDLIISKAFKIKNRESLIEEYHEGLSKHRSFQLERIQRAGNESTLRHSGSKIKEERKEVEKCQRARDFLIVQYSEEYEIYDCGVKDLETQISELQRQTMEAKKYIQEGDEQIENILRDKTRILQEWSVTVRNIENRDAIKSFFSQILLNKTSENKQLKAEISSLKKALVSLQETHDHFTQMETSLRKNYNKTKNSILFYNRSIEESRNNLVELQKRHRGTSDTLAVITNELKDLEKEKEVLFGELSKYLSLRTTLSNESLTILQSSLNAVKESKILEEEIVQTRKRKEACEILFLKSQNENSHLQDVIYLLALDVQIESKNFNELESQVCSSKDIVFKMSQELKNKENLIDTKKSKFQMKLQEKEAYYESKDKPSALSSELQSLQLRVESLESSNEENKIKWTKTTNAFIAQLSKRNELENKKRILLKKASVLKDKSTRVSEEIESKSKETTKIQQRIQMRLDSISRIQSNVVDGQHKIKSRSLNFQEQSFTRSQTLDSLTFDIERCKKDNDSLIASIVTEKVINKDRNNELENWKSIYQNYKETRSLIIHSSKFSYQDLKLEIHRLEIDLIKVRKESKGIEIRLANALKAKEGFYDKKKSEKSEFLQQRRLQHFDEQNKKKIEQEAKRGKMAKRTNEHLLCQISKAKSENQILLSENQEWTRKLRNYEKKMEDLNNEITELCTSKDSNNGKSVIFQTKAKNYELVLEDKYKLHFKFRERNLALEIFHRLQNQNKCLIDVVLHLVHLYPHLDVKLKKIVFYLTSSYSQMNDE